MDVSLEVGVRRLNLSIEVPRTHTEVTLTIRERLEGHIVAFESEHGQSVLSQRGRQAAKVIATVGRGLPVDPNKY